MSETPPTARIRWLIATLIVMVALGLLLSLVYATDAVLSIIERLERLPSWYTAGALALTALIGAGAGWAIWRVLRPRRVRRETALPAPPDRSQVDARLAAISGEAEAARLSKEMAELDRRAHAGTLYLALFGEVSAGKSSLVRALLPGAEVRVDVRAGTTRAVRHHEGRDREEQAWVLADVPGFGEWGGADRAAAARAEALRAHAVLYVIDTDLTASQMEEIEWLRAFGKPILLLLNKSDRYDAGERAALAARLRERTRLDPILVSAGGRERIEVIAADGTRGERERERQPEIAALRAALARLQRTGAGELEPARERAVLQAVTLEIGAVEQQRRQREAEALVRDYARKAALGALAAVAPGTDLVIQGVLATRLVSELARLYDTPVRAIDLDDFVTLAGGRLRGSSALVLAIAGNALKAFPGLGTVGGGLVHAVAYALIFDSLGRAVADTLAKERRFDRERVLERFEGTLGDRSTLAEIAPAMARIALEARQAGKELSGS